MRRLVFACICITAVNVYTAAETVMVSLRNDTGVEYFTEERVRLASAVVEGAMDVFFQADHIVFDLGLPSDEPEQRTDRVTAAVIARLGGAGYMLDLRVGKPEVASGVPGYVAYDFIDVVDNRVLASGAVRRSDADPNATAEHICLFLGESAALEAIRALRDI